jgi:hypothetical protein
LTSLGNGAIQVVVVDDPRSQIKFYVDSTVLERAEELHDLVEPGLAGRGGLGIRTMTKRSDVFREALALGLRELRDEDNGAVRKTGESARVTQRVAPEEIAGSDELVDLVTALTGRTCDVTDVWREAIIRGLRQLEATKAGPPNGRARVLSRRK